jgi:hypothetical protein
MTEAPHEPTVEERQTANFLGLILLLRQMASQLIQEKRIPDARGLIDALAAIQAKTEGNLREREKAMLEEVLYELRMAVLHADEDSTEANEEGGEGEKEGDRPSEADGSADPDGAEEPSEGAST